MPQAFCLLILEDLDIEIHLVKENQVISKDAKSQAKFIHGINLVVAKNYSDNLREEVKKGMREKASQGTVIDPDGEAVDQAKVWTSVGGESKKVSAGWEFDIPAVTRPADGRLSLFAAAPPMYSPSRSDLVLESDYNPTVVIQFRKGELASVRGIVIDGSRRGVEGAVITVVGSQGDGATTQRDGQFLLATHVTDGQQVLLHVEKQGYLTVEQYQPAGSEPAAIVLSLANGRK